MTHMGMVHGRRPCPGGKKPLLVGRSIPVLPPDGSTGIDAFSWLQGAVAWSGARCLPRWHDNVSGDLHCCGPTADEARPGADADY